MEERRRFLRLPANDPAKITIEGGARTIDCIVVDFSLRGARLEIDRQAELPARFNILLSSDGITRACRLIWRLENRAGVEFG